MHLIYAYPEGELNILWKEIAHSFVFFRKFSVARKGLEKAEPARISREDSHGKGRQTKWPGYATRKKS